MPSFIGTPLQLALAGGEGRFTPARFSGSPLALRITSGSVTVGPSLSTDLSAIAAILDTLFASEAIVDAQGRPTLRFQQIWQNTIQGIKDILTGQGLSITELQRIYAGINQAQATASSAVQQAQETSSVVSVANSRTDPVDGNLTASSDGTITISAHDRVYGDGARVSVNGGSLSGFSPGQFIRVYYVDAGHAGGAVSYQGTTDEVVTEGSTLVVGGVLVPQVGEVPNSGVPPFPPGWVTDQQYALPTG